MNTKHDRTPDEMTFENIERAIQRARRMRGEAIADMGIALRSAVQSWVHCVLLHVRAAVSGNTAEKCA